MRLILRYALQRRPYRGAILVTNMIKLNLYNKNKMLWRTVRDSNPRDGSPPTHFPGVRLRPLGHLSLEACLTCLERQRQEKLHPLPFINCKECREGINFQNVRACVDFGLLYFRFSPRRPARPHLYAPHAYRRKAASRSGQPESLS